MSVPPYPRDAIYVAYNETILLRFIESFSTEREEDDRVVDKLKDDYSFKVRTISGKEYTISSKFILDTLELKMSNHDLVQSIYDKWLWINKS